MKKIISSTLLMIAVCLCTFSCYDDKSTVNTDSITPMTVDTTDMGGALRIGYQEVLELNPKFSGRSEDEFTYEWTLTDQYQEMSTVLSTSKDLSETISVAISSSAYKLSLTLTDLVNDNLQQSIVWDLYVESSFGEGMLVCDTKDGITSDFTLVMNNDLTADHNDDERVTPNILSTGYGQGIAGGVKQVYYGCDGSMGGTHYNRVYAISDNGVVYKYNADDFSVMSTSEDDLILYKSPSFEPYSLTASSTKTAMSTSDGFYYLGYTMSANATFSSPDVESVPSNGVISNDSYSWASVPVLIWYDESKSLFYAYRSQFAQPTIGTYPDNTTSAFNAGNYPDSEAVAGGLSIDGETHTFIMRNKTSGDYSLLTFSRDTYDDDYNLTSSVGSSIKAVPSEAAAVLDKAVSVFFARSNAVAYIVTETEVYAMLFSGASITFDPKPKYTAASGETITAAEIYMQGAYKVDKSTIPDTYTELALNNKALAITTQKSEYDGSVYIVPEKEAGTGNLDADNQQVYSGFGNIQSITFTAR